MAIKDEDFVKIKNIVNNAEKISYVGKDSENHDLLKFEKNIDGNNIFTAYISKKHKNLELKTLYKQKKNSVTALNMEKSTLNSTSKTTSDTSSINNIIPSSRNYVNESDNTEVIDNIAKEDMKDINKVLSEDVKTKSSDELWNELVNNSSEEAQELLDGVILLY